MPPVSHPTIPTFAGDLSRAETYLKLLHHLREAQSLCAVMAHLHNTESNPADQLIARAWIEMSEKFGRSCNGITLLAQRRLN